MPSLQEVPLNFYRKEQMNFEDRLFEISTINLLVDFLQDESNTVAEKKAFIKKIAKELK